MTILVTGGAGFIGSHFVREALRDDESIVVYDINFITSTVFSDLVGSDKVFTVKGNVLNVAKIVETIKKYDVKRIVHTASLLTIASQEDPLLAIDVNVKGTVNVLEASRLTGVERVVYTSSQAVYGYTAEEPVDEDYPKKPCTIYGVTKLACELIGLNYRETYGVDFIALRFPLVYGPGKIRGFGVIEELVEKSRKGLGVIIARGGDQKYEPLYVKDAAKALMLALRVHGLKHYIFNIGSGQMLGFQEITEIVKKFLPKVSVKIGPGHDILDCTRGLLRCERARLELSYKPAYSFEEGIKDYLRMLGEL